MRNLIRKIIPEFIHTQYGRYLEQQRLKPFRGEEVWCLLCQAKFKKFAPFGVVERENALCHQCGSLERHRLLWKYLKDKTKLLDGNARVKLLHFAPERSLYHLFCQESHIEYFPCDLYPEQFQYQGKVEVIRADITNMPFRDHFFDVAIASHVLEHVPDDRLAMKELFRVIKKGGWGIFQVPVDYHREVTYEDPAITSPAEREKAFGQYDHCRWYGRDYENRLREAGFSVTVDDFVKTFTPEEVFQYGFVPSELIYHCRK